MEITTTINMDLNQPGPVPVIHCMQNDAYSRKVEIYLFSGGVAFEPPEGAAAMVSYRKADGTGGVYDTLPDGSAGCSFNETATNLLQMTLAPQTLTAPGPVQLCVNILSGEAQLSTFHLKLMVGRDPAAAAASEDYYNVQHFVPSSGWEPGKILGIDAKGKVVAINAPESSVEVAVDEVLEAMPVVSRIDFSQIYNGSYTEIVDGVAETHAVEWTGNGMIIDGGLEILFPEEPTETTETEETA